MRNFDKLIIIFVLVLSSTCLAQEHEFGKVSKEELLEKSYLLDSVAKAAILLERKKVYYTSTGGGLHVVTEIFKRIKIYNKEGFDYATEEILLHKNQRIKEKITTLKGTTYTFLEGKILKTPLDKDGVFEEEYSKNYEIAKFTMPAIKEGSVIEFAYTVVSPFVFDIDKVNLQYRIPIKKIDVHLRIPKFISFRKFSTGFIPVNLKEFSKKDSGFNVHVNHFTSTNVPAFVEEPYSGNSNNYISSVLYEVSVIKYPNGPIVNFSNTWEDVVKTVYKSSNFGAELEKRSYFKKDIDSVLAGITEAEDKALAVFRFVKRKMTWNNKKSLFTKNGVKKAYRKGLGNSAEINLMLTAMLDYSGVNSNPIIVSTSDKTLSLFPTVSGFNYVISRVKLPDNSILYLDATDKFGAPNILPDRVLKGLGRVIAENRTSQMINYRPVKPSMKRINLQYEINSDGEMEGKCKIRYFNFFAHSFRTNHSQKNNRELRRQLEKEYRINDLGAYSISNTEFDKALSEQFNFKIDDEFEMIANEIFFSPLLFLVQKENIFKADERKCPIDFGFGFTYSYLVNIKIPEGYKVVDFPKETVFSLPKKLGFYSFKTAVNNDVIQILVNKTINNSIIIPEHYTFIKEFYNQVIQKEEEQIVLKKI